eukprot:scaffold1848_cov132-Skeletonema_menzelii.AAC.2
MGHHLPSTSERVGAHGVKVIVIVPRARVPSTFTKESNYHSKTLQHNYIYIQNDQPEDESQWRLVYMSLPH